MHRRKSKEQWEQLVEQYRELGVGRKAFCEQEGLKLSTFGYWYRKLNRSEEEESITCVELALPNAGYRIAEEIIDIRIRSEEIQIPLADSEACVKIHGNIGLVRLAKIVTACAGDNNVHH